MTHTETAKRHTESKEGPSSLSSARADNPLNTSMREPREERRTSRTNRDMPRRERASHSQEEVQSVPESKSSWGPGKIFGAGMAVVGTGVVATVCYQVLQSGIVNDVVQWGKENTLFLAFLPLVTLMGIGFGSGSTTKEKTRPNN